MDPRHGQLAGAALNSRAADFLRPQAVRLGLHQGGDASVRSDGASEPPNIGFDGIQIDLEPGWE
ncbi:hypothetical protein D3C83_109100 [compost metagenome]